MVCTVLSVDQDNSPEILAMNAASIALFYQAYHLLTLLLQYQVGLIDGKFVLNPTSKERE